MARLTRVVRSVDGLPFRRVPHMLDRSTASCVVDVDVVLSFWG